MALLHIISKRWEDIAKALHFDKDRVDEIFTNNETDYLRLHELVEYYFMNVHFSHSWEEMVRVLTEVEEHALAARIQAEQIQGVCVVLVRKRGIAFLSIIGEHSLECLTYPIYTWANLLRVNPFNL